MVPRRPPRPGERAFRSRQRVSRRGGVRGLRRAGVTASERTARRGDRSAEPRVRPADCGPARDRRARRRGDDQAARVLRRGSGRASGTRGGRRSRDRAIERLATATRESVVAQLAARIRTDSNLDAVLEHGVAVVAEALRAERCFVRLGEPDGAMTVKAQWHRDGLEPIGDLSLARLAVSNLAMRDRSTVALADVATAPELDDAAHGGRQGLLELGSRSVLATPIIVFDRLIGVLAVHRNVPGAWPAARRCVPPGGRAGARARSRHGAAARRPRASPAAADRSLARGADADQRARVPGSPRGPRQRGRPAARRGCRGLLALRRASAHARLSGRPRPARERERDERSFPAGRSAKRSRRGDRS